MPSSDSETSDPSLADTIEFPAVIEPERAVEPERESRVELRLGVGDSIAVYRSARTIELVLGANTEPIQLIHDLPLQLRKAASLLLLQPGALSPDLKRGWCPMDWEDSEFEHSVCIGRGELTDEFDLGPEVSGSHLLIEVGNGPAPHHTATRITNLGRNGTIVRVCPDDITYRSDGVLTQ